ncbi:MAG: cytochrome bc complex cytochrome b subunit [Bacteroidetes bacterium]|nr:cytochrome bc complex cytochrome b subunit [Bacteroidota bacterium]
MASRVTAFVEDRIDLTSIRAWAARRKVPQHKHSFWYYFGGLALFILVVQIISGILLAFYYSPTPASANESVRYVMEKVHYGWLIRSIHVWGANLLIAVVVVHMFSAYFMKAYRKPREVMWVIGVLILALILTSAFTGYLLPWTTLSYFATKIGVSMPLYLPVVGGLLSRVMQGGADVGAATLTRMFTLHTIVLPILWVILISVHVFLTQVLGLSTPVSQTGFREETRFFPNFMMRQAAVWSGGLAVLLAFVTIYPANLTPKVNSLLPAPAGIKPEWYFLFVFQTLRTFPDIVGLGALTLGGIIWMLVPFLDRKSLRGEKSIFFTLFGIAVIVYVVTMTVMAYITTEVH